MSHFKLYLPINILNIMTKIYLSYAYVDNQNFENNDRAWVSAFKDDLENEILRTPLDPVITYSDDPLRMMRAIRFATQLNFEIEKESLEAISRNHERIKIITNERIVVELHKCLNKKFRLDTTH